MKNNNMMVIIIILASISPLYLAYCFYQAKKNVESSDRWRKGWLTNI